jgi:hypothetical protein
MTHSGAFHPGTIYLIFCKACVAEICRKIFFGRFDIRFRMMNPAPRTRWGSEALLHCSD